MTSTSTLASSPAVLSAAIQSVAATLGGTATWAVIVNSGAPLTGSRRRGRLGGLDVDPEPRQARCDLVDDALVVGAGDPDFVGQPADVLGGPVGLGPTDRDLVALRDERCERPFESDLALLGHRDKHQDRELATEPSHAARFHVAVKLEQRPQ